MYPLIRVVMLPHPKWFRSEESGIRQVVANYARYFPDYGIRLVDEDAEADLVATHAGESKKTHAAHLHGLYWSADLASASWEYAVNAQVIDLIRMSHTITVPSEWVAQTIRRDTKRPVTVIPHGIEWGEWQDEEPQGDYILWNKNRDQDVCDPAPMVRLAERRPNVHFVTTFAKNYPNNVSEPLGVIPHAQMKKLVQSCLVYLSTTKETFGIGILEAMAAGRPILGFGHGGILDLVQHGVNGYLAQPGNIDDLAHGLDYCLQHGATLGANGRELAKSFTWAKSVEKVRAVYERTIELMAQPHEVSVIIPAFNYADKVGRAIESVQSQTYPAKKIIVVDDCSPDDGATERAVGEYAAKDNRVMYVRQPNNSGVAAARNHGIALCDTRYWCCLDADDALAPQFLEACVPALKKDPSLGIAYTGLQYILPDGKTGVSKWPGKWDFDAQLQKHNQVPTACVGRRDMWEQLGGYKSRYCPIGAGSEDAEFWTRSGEYGWKAEQVTSGPLFIYSWQSGRVSGNHDYQEVDWLEWHPWARDGQHLLASYAKPKKWSHPVRQYDEPVVSVVIPVGPGHGGNLYNALDSLEAQTFRKWEVIVVNDSGTPLDLVAYPYAHLVTTEGKQGAGFARNRGVDAAVAPLLLFLDADDWLYPEALQKMLVTWENEEACVYTDFVGKAQVDDVSKLAKDLQARVLWRDEKTHDTVIRYELPEYNWERAQIQPEGQPWIWCNVTTLTPKKWHYEIGGFDEGMPAWEDVDYWYRMAFAGKPFVRVAEPLLVYLFYAGNRRDTGYRNHQDLIRYLQNKYREVVKMPCGGCGKKKNPAQPPARNATVAPSNVPRQPTPQRAVATVDPNVPTIGDEDFVLCDYISPNRGAHHLVGHATYTTRVGNLPMIHARNINAWRIDYGYRAGGERFLVHRRDMQAAPHLFVQVALIRQEEPQMDTPPPVSITEEAEPAAVGIEEEREELPAPPTLAPEQPRLTTNPTEPLTSFSMQKLPGVTATIAENLTEAGITTLQQLIALGDEGLQRFRGIGAARAAAIMEAARKQVGA